MALPLLGGGCSSENKTNEQGSGTLQISCGADPSIDSSTGGSRASRAITEPEGDAFSVSITGESGTQNWNTVAEFEQSQTVFKMGDYSVSIAHGDPDAEGLDKPYYTGTKQVTVRPRRENTVEITATIGNSQVVVRATEQFLNYFHDAEFSVTTASENTFDFTPGSDPADEAVFVKAATSLKVTGTAKRQSPTGEGDGPEVTFGEQTLEATAARTCHIFTYDAQNAGSATLTITLGDNYTETRQLDVELNDNAIDD